MATDSPPVDADPALNAMLLERCEPAAARDLPEPEQDAVVAGCSAVLAQAADLHPFGRSR